MNLDNESYQFGDLTVYYAGGPNSPYKSTLSEPCRYEDIQKCYNKDKLYVDPDFVAESVSIGGVGGDSANTNLGKLADSYSWHRPAEILTSLPDKKGQKPMFAVAQDSQYIGTDLCSSHDIMQGTLGDCGYLAAVAALASKQEQIKIVIPEDNFVGFDDDKYCGAFHFRFYSVEQNKWFDIVIDDRLPCTKYGEILIPAFASVARPTSAEFWVAFVEKAYAKFIGSYAAIEGTYISHALANFTGGFSEIYPFRAELEPSKFEYLETKDTYEIVKGKIARYLKAGYFIGLDSMSNDLIAKYGVQKGYGPTGLGLVNPHGYTILDAQEIKSKAGDKSWFLIKVRNPHSRTEWRGDFSDIDDVNWALAELDLRQAVGPNNFKNIDEGIFWIELADVLTYFHALEACLYGLGETQFTSYRGEWPGSLQSQTINCFRPTDEQFKLLPAYKFEAKQGKLSKSHADKLGTKCVIAFSLVACEYRPFQTIKSGHTPSFSYFLFKETDDGKLEVANISGWNAFRENSNWLILESGKYIILPILDTQKEIPKSLAGQSIPFTIRLYTEVETIIEFFGPIPLERVVAPKSG